MEWFGVEVSDILSAEFLALPEGPRANWLSLHAYCAFHENGGVLKDAVNWTDRQWSFAAGLRLRGVRALLSCGLLRVSEESDADYVLALYDLSGEQKTQHTSRIRANAAKTRWQKHANARAGVDAKPDASNARDETRRDETRRDETRRDETIDQHEQPARARRAQRPSPLGSHRAEAEQLWALQEKLRAEAIPGSRPLEASEKRLERVAARLAAGARFADCEHVLRVYAEDARIRIESRQWFNGETNWREDNFDRALGRSVAPAKPATPPVSRLTEETRRIYAEREAAADRRLDERLAAEAAARAGGAA